MSKLGQEKGLSIRRLARAFEVPVSTTGRWVSDSPRNEGDRGSRKCPISGDPNLKTKIHDLCHRERYQSYGYRRIRALLRKEWDIKVSRKTVWRIMREEGLSRPKIWHRPYRPKRLQKVEVQAPNKAWQIDMTSFQLSDLTPLFLVVVIDCFSRQIVGWTLDRRCRASEWVSAVRVALESRSMETKNDCKELTLRSDNGAQPCSKKFAEYVSSCGLTAEFTGYNAPDDNAFVERVIRTLKEEEIWLNLYDSVTEAHQAIDEYIRFYNNERIHSALNYQTPDQVYADNSDNLKAA